ncbi:hypothetical protein HDV00_008750 [Rhizophlyctis rosea]|nr:hypothetical protein HDV00_008750 [Rhizophlyctis rosea]
MKIAYTLSNSQATKVIVHEHLRKKIEEAMRTIDHDVDVVTLCDFDSKGVDGRQDLAPEPFDLDRGAQIIYTSGTTGKPKGVLTTHRNIQHQVETLLEAWRWSEEDRILHVLPLHHVHGIINALTCPLWVGATCEFLTPFDAEKVWKRWSDDKRDLTLFMGVPAIYVKLLQTAPQNAREICEQFRLMVSGSAPLPDSVFGRWEEVTGQRLLERYGMTEIGMAVGNPCEDVAGRVPGTVGFPFPGVEIRVVDEGGNEVGLEGEEAVEGELWVKGGQVFKEYWNNPAATKKELIDGWFKTGDIVRRGPDGRITILGRASADIIKSGGYKISALEIEREIMDHPNVKDVAILGVPDEVLGEVVAALIVVEDTTTPLTVESLREFLTTRMAKYKIPRKVKVVEEVPRNAMGKVQKKLLKGLF